MSKAIGYIIEDGSVSGVNAVLSSDNTTIDNNWTNILATTELLDGTKVRYAVKFDPVILDSGGRIRPGSVSVATFGNANVAAPTLEFRDFGAPIAANTSVTHAAITQPTTGTTTVTTGFVDSDVPRIFTVTGNQSSCTGNLVLTIECEDGTFVDETVAIAGTSTVPTVNAGVRITEAIVPTRGSAADAITLGRGVKLGVGMALARKTVLISIENGIQVSPFLAILTPSGTMSQNLVAFATAPNGASRQLYFVAG